MNRSVVVTLVGFLCMTGTLCAQGAETSAAGDNPAKIVWQKYDQGGALILNGSLYASSNPEDGVSAIGVALEKTFEAGTGVPAGRVVCVSVRSADNGRCELTLDATDGNFHSRCTVIKIVPDKWYEVQLTVLPCEGRWVARGEYRAEDMTDFARIVDSSESPSSPDGVWRSGKTYVQAPEGFNPRYVFSTGKCTFEPPIASKEKCPAPKRGFARRDINKYPLTVLEYSWTSMDTKYYRDNLRQVEKVPFDGRSVFIAEPRLPHGSVVSGAGGGDFGWEVFQNKKLTREMILPAIADMNAAKSRSLRSNYLVCTTFLPGGYMNWFDDGWWANISNNARLLGTAARQGGFEGIMLDPEEYGCDLWAYHPLATKPEYAGKSFEEVSAKVRQRGREFIRAINSSYPGVRIWSLLAWDQIYTFRTKDKFALKDAWGTLTIPFLDGMLEGSDDNTIIIDGIEGGYYLDALPDFVQRAKDVKEKAIYLSDVPDLFKKKVRTGFGIYLDRSQQWDPVNVEGNYWSPKRLEDVLYYALISSDGFVWLWNERPTWLISSADEKLGGGIDFGAGRNERIKPVPKVYWQALKNAKLRAQKWLRGK